MKHGCKTRWNHMRDQSLSWKKHPVQLQSIVITQCVFTVSMRIKNTDGNFVNSSRRWRQLKQSPLRRRLMLWVLDCFVCLTEYIPSQCCLPLLISCPATPPCSADGMWTAFPVFCLNAKVTLKKKKKIKTAQKNKGYTKITHYRSEWLNADPTLM